MRRPALLLSPLLAALLAACTADTVPAGTQAVATAGTPADAAARDGNARPAIDPAATSPDLTADGVTSAIEQHCAEAVMRLEQVAPLRSTLRLKQADGSFRPVAAPPGLVAYAPLGIDCAFSPKDGSTYFLVEFGVPRRICRDCTWPVLFDTAGRPLNDGPPKSLGDGRFDVSAFEALRTRLGLGAPQTHRLEWK